MGDTPTNCTFIKCTVLRFLNPAYGNTISLKLTKNILDIELGTYTDAKSAAWAFALRFALSEYFQLSQYSMGTIKIDYTFCFLKGFFSKCCN